MDVTTGNVQTYPSEHHVNISSAVVTRQLSTGIGRDKNNTGNVSTEMFMISIILLGAYLKKKVYAYRLGNPVIC